MSSIRIWIRLNVGVFGAAREFDKFPFGLLTLDHVEGVVRRAIASSVQLEGGAT